MFAVSYACDPPNVAKARSLIERNLRIMQTKPVTAAELDQAKILLLRAIPLSESSIQGIAGGLLDRSTRDLPLDEPITAAKRYAAFTAADIQAAFAEMAEGRRSGAGRLGAAAEVGDDRRRASISAVQRASVRGILS